jgi:multimeric flavodoxin WrbA
MIRIAAVYGSPRRKGNTSLLLDQAVRGAREAGAEVSRLILCDFDISPCLEIYGCKKAGICAIRDDFDHVREQILSSDGVMLASPIFFYSVSAQTKIFIDRFQSLWVKKNWVENTSEGRRKICRKGLFISVGATKGKKLFDGALLTIRYFFDVIDTKIWKTLLYRNIDHEGDVMKHPDYLNEAYHTGINLVSAITPES